MPGQRKKPKKHGTLATEQLDAVADLFGVLSEPSRLRILQVLQDGEASVGELVDRCGIKQANMSKQLAILAAAGIVDRRQEGNRVVYRIGMPLVFELCSLVCGSITERAWQRAESLSHSPTSASAPPTRRLK
ncbi:MAG: winged helix-turn-helix transcriptional regulator [Phycisphaerales bacterium]|nr:winged helix-turn-helix transcriptional regulator [Phycisphaerales bacterium]